MGTGEAQSYAGRGDLLALQQWAAAGHPIDEADAKGDTPLLYAVFSCHREVWEWLLDHGANVQQANAKGDTVLHHIARRFKSGDDALADLQALIERGADIEAVNHMGYTPLLQEAARSIVSDGKKQPRMSHLEQLLDEGANPLATTHDGETLTSLMGSDALPLIAHHRENQVAHKSADALRQKPTRARLRT